MNEYREFKYAVKEDYDAHVKINGEKLAVYSPKKLKEQNPHGESVTVGETFEKKKRDKDRDIGRIELNEQRLNVGKDGDHNKLFKKQGAFVEVEGGGYIALLRLRLLPILLLFFLLLCGIGAVVWTLLPSRETPVDPNQNDPHIEPIVSGELTVSGTVYYGDTGAGGAVLVLYAGDTEVATATADGTGKYLFAKVQKGIYNLVATYENQAVTTLVWVDEIPVVRDFHLTDANLSVQVVVEGEKTPAIAVGGLDADACRYIKDGKRVEVTLFAEELPDGEVPEDDKTKIRAFSQDLNMTYFDFHIDREVFSLLGVSEEKTSVTATEQPLEIAVPFDNSRSIGVYVFRCHEGEATRFEELSARPTSNYRDGTYYFNGSYVFIYTDSFSTYAIGTVSNGNVVRGSDTITYSDVAYLNVKTGKTEMRYEHDASSTHNARVKIYLVGKDADLLVSVSGIVPPGYSLTSMTVQDGVNLPSPGTYEGKMIVEYLGEDAQAATQVEIRLTVVISQ